MTAGYQPISHPDYPCACGCGELIEYVYAGKRRTYISPAHRVRAYRRDNPAYVEAERVAGRRRASERPRSTPPSECLCGCGVAPPARAGDVGRHPRYATEECRRKARKALI